MKHIEGLFNQHYEFLCNTANRLLNDRNAAKDVVQDVFLQLWRTRIDLKIVQSERAYLYRAVVNGSLKYLAKNKRTILVNEDSALHSDLKHRDVEEAMGYQELERDYKKALNLLPQKCRAIFVLSRHEEMKYKDIAGYLEVSVKTVETQMSIALKRLREYLDPYLTFLLLAAGVL
ncbi:MAG: RNA polymerase sigma-70 factor [Flavobacteriales bacterium]|nr:RNA polymerase sigma-70 factor [Flavobacteriales bacterium]